MAKDDLTDQQRRFAIESGIPIAPGRARRTLYRFAEMEVGDSFAIGNEYREQVNVRQAVMAWNKAHAPMHFAVRLIRETGKYRCWRVT